MENYNLEDLKQDLFLGDYGEYITEYNDGYIDDIIQEIADNNVDIYNYDLFKWVADDLNNIWYCDRALQEFGCTDIIGVLTTAQYLYNDDQMRDNLEDILKYWSYNYIQDTYDLKEITEEQNDELEAIDYTAYSRLDEIQDLIDEIFGEDEE